MRLLNAFSLNMVGDLPAMFTVEKATLEQAREHARDSESAVGHADTAAVFESVLGVPVPANRATVTLSKGESCLVGQYKGPRLAEGTTELPEGATIEWLLVTVR